MLMVCTVHDTALGKLVIVKSLIMDFVLVASFLAFLFLESTAAEITTDDASPMEQAGGSVTTIWVTFVAVILTILVIFACGILSRKLYRRFHKSETIEENEGETTVMLTSFREFGDTSSDIKNQFRKGLQKKYRHLCEAAQRTPYLEDKNSFTERAFVESGLKFIGAKQEIGSRDKLSNLNSYKDMFYVNSEQFSMIILEGEPGYGKSTLSLKLAHDWCNSIEGSFLYDVEILILLHLRQCHDVSSIYTAIKKFVLPKHTGLTESDIKSILQHSKSVTVILDGFDEYSGQGVDANSDIYKIIARKMFKDFRVVLTTTSSCLPHKYPISAKRVKLTGFDDEARENYIRKALIGNDRKDALKILEYLKQNPILNEICQGPFLFVQFAHMAQSNSRIREQHSVTSFFNLAFSCFKSLKYTEREINVINDESLIEDSYSSLGKIAFEALSGTQILIWKKKELFHKLGQNTYESYIGYGILVEDEEIYVNDDDGIPTNHKSDGETEVRFYHKLLQEWYAAHYLTEYLQQNSSANLEEILQNLDPFKHQYFYRFACGLNAQCAVEIIEYLKKIEGDENFVILCMFEQFKEVENIIKPIRQMCSEGINISGHDSLLQQRVSVNILEEAKYKKIPVKGVHLQNCIESVDLQRPAIITISGMAISSGILLKNLSITLTNKILEDLEAENILEFAAQCHSLRRLVFGSCLPPYSFKISSVHSPLKSRNVKVGWKLFDSYPFYILNLKSGRWQSENEGVELPKDDYEKMYLERQDASKMWTDEYNIDMAKADRKYLREVAAK